MVRLAAVTVAGLLLAACGAVPSTHPSAARPTDAAPVEVTVDDSANGTVRTVAPGATLTVVLHSTYWLFAPPSDPAAVRPVGQPAVDGLPPGRGCVPGAGCGTVTARYVADHPGTATISAARRLCGEALTCAPAASSWELTVVVR